MIMRINVLKLENNCVIIDEEYYKYLKEKAELNEVKIEELASEKYLKAIKESGIELSYQINGIPLVFRRGLIDELNYDERGLPESVSEKVKYAIADDITDYLNEHFAHWKDDCMAYARSILDENRQHWKQEAKLREGLWIRLLAFSIGLLLFLIMLFVFFTLEYLLL